MTVPGGSKTTGAKGARVYTSALLSVYDVAVLGFNNHLIWRCPTALILNEYSQWASGNHLEVGVGTGYYLDRCRFPVAEPRIGLLDLNANPLQKAAKRLSRYHPETYQADVLQPLQIAAAPFDSVALTYLLHCLPVDPLGKPAVIGNLRPLLNPEARVFGATVLGEQAVNQPPGKLMTWAFNHIGIFDNRGDTHELLERGLRDYLDDVEIHVEGAVALFAGLLRPAVVDPSVAERESRP